jgi:hypothetical protein
MKKHDWRRHVNGDHHDGQKKEALGGARGGRGRASLALSVVTGQSQETSLREDKTEHRGS